MYMLGISAYCHDSAACLAQDGEIVVAAQEERFTRKKHGPGFPSRAVAYYLAQAGIGIKDLKYVVFYDKPLIKFERLLATYLGFAPLESNRSCALPFLEYICERIRHFVN